MSTQSLREFHGQNREEKPYGLSTRRRHIPDTGQCGSNIGRVQCRVRLLRQTETCQCSANLVGFASCSSLNAHNTPRRRTAPRNEHMSYGRTTGLRAIQSQVYYVQGPIKFLLIAFEEKQNRCPNSRRSSPANLLVRTCNWRTSTHRGTLRTGKPKTKSVEIGDERKQVNRAGICASQTGSYSGTCRLGSAQKTSVKR